MKKTIPAALAALVMTVCLGAGMFALTGGSFLSSVSAAPAPTQTPAADVSALPADQQAIIAEYQAREAQYQAQIAEAANRINTANQQIELANQQLQSYQNLLAQLQDSGLITIGSDGTITINQPQQTGWGFGGHGDHH